MMTTMNMSTGPSPATTGIRETVNSGLSGRRIAFTAPSTYARRLSASSSFAGRCRSPSRPSSSSPPLPPSPPSGHTFFPEPSTPSPPSPSPPASASRPSPLPSKTRRRHPLRRSPAPKMSPRHRGARKGRRGPPRG
uniref:Uncharacterized protein n=1 Tax=Ananas comosus var. bracteatus TaxID=296719 RepID=A0A6V7Q837_ANACO|nr:unnamed protein product [Ananas comosus var. bracteatus]